MSRKIAPALFAVLAGAFLAAPGRAQSTPKPDLSKQPTLYVVGYAHLDTEWRWEYPQVIDEYLLNTMQENFDLFQKYPHYIFNFSGANRYRLMKEYYPDDFARVKQFVAEGRWYPAGSSMEEGDVNAPSAEAILRQILYGNNWFRKEFGIASAEYMLPDCFGFPASLPTILAHSGVKGFSTQKLTWGSSVERGGPDSLERTPEGTPFNVGVWVGPDGEKVLAGLNPGSYSGGISTDLSKPLPAEAPNPRISEVQDQIQTLRTRLEAEHPDGKGLNEKEIKQFISLRNELDGLKNAQKTADLDRFQGDWAARVENNGKADGVFTDYHYFGTGDIGGAPDEESVSRLEAMVTHGKAEMPPAGYIGFRGVTHAKWPETSVGDGPVRVISSRADQMFLDITPGEEAHLPEYTGEMELTNHSAGSLTSQAYQKRWIRKEELLADAAEKASVAAAWLGGRQYPMDRLNSAWTLSMAAHFHDLAAGTATPKAYEFAWNDDVVAMNQFAGVLRSGSEAVASALNTQTDGIPVIVYNPLNIEREGVVSAKLDFPGGMPQSVAVTGPDGQALPAQVSGGNVIFLAKVPSVGYAVYSVHAGKHDTAADALHVSQNSLENHYYRVSLNSDGDIDAIFDKQLGKNLLSAPMRLAISYDNPDQWPAWNMDWDQEEAAPRQYVGGPATLRVVENGPVRVAIEVSRETAGSKFVQTIMLAAGEAGKRVEIKNDVDWNTRESNLKAVFPLTAQNQLATYNLGIGTIQRPSDQPRKFEVLSHQWIDLTDATGAFGATILTDSKNGSDKPNDNTIRLTLLRTPGVHGGYADQATQDLGHHEFTYGIAGHANDWRACETDWQGEELNDPLIAFTTTRHAGALGHRFSLVKISDPRVRIMALKRAEDGDELILRMVELDGKPEANVRVAFASPVRSAREVNGQEQPVGPAVVKNGELLTSFTAYQPRTFAIHLQLSATKVAPMQSQPVELHYNLAVATNTGSHVSTGFDSKGDSLPAEMLPEKIDFHGAEFKLAAAKTGEPDALTADGQTIDLPKGDYNRVYILAASAGGDQDAVFKLGNETKSLNVQDWGGFIGQWDDRQWIAKDVTTPASADRPAETEHDDYAEMTGIQPGYIKRADVAWYSSHHHDAAGKNIAYSYSYLFGYSIPLPAGARTITLPKNDSIRILAISVARENPELTPAQPLYDTLGRSEPAALAQK